jgi:signal transduction histidine kinase
MQLDLRRRLALALIGLSVGLAGALATALWIGSNWIESTTLDHVLQRELEVYVDAAADPSRLQGTAELRYYRPAIGPPPVPVELAALAPGSYRDFDVGKKNFHVLVRDVTPGDRAWLLYDVDAFSERERALQLALIVGVLAAALAAWLASGWIAQRALKPLDALVARIRAIDPGRHGQRLESWEEDGELDVIVAALNDHMARLDALVTRERAFAGAASHELRTPLAAIRGAAEVLALMPGVPREVLERIERSVNEAVADLDALLALSQGRELPASQSLQLHKFLPRAAHVYAAQAIDNETRIVWLKSPPVTLEASPGLLAIIFTNLLRNAIRATPSGEVQIGFDASAVWIADNGEGMTAEQLKSVFEPGVKSRHGGSGMGLYIAHTLAHRCGWTLTLESEAGKGTKATLTFR